MRSILTSHQLYPALQALLGLPDMCTSFELRASADGMLLVSCEHYLYGSDASIAQLVKVFGEFELVRRAECPQPHPADQMGFDAWMRDRTERAHFEFMSRRLPQ